MKTELQQPSTPATPKPKRGQFKTMQELADHKYRDLMPKLEAALKDHPHFQKKGE